MEVFLIIAAVWIASAVPAYFLLRRWWLRDLDFSRADRACLLVIIALFAPAALATGIVFEIIAALSGDGDKILIHRKNRK